MFETYSKFVGKDDGPNRFWHVADNEVEEAESRMGLTFPSDLQAFFTEVGSGFWAQGTADAEWDRSLVNRILSPSQVADMVCDEQNVWRPSEGFPKGVIPFFDIGDNAYLVMQPQSDTPNRVYWPGGRQIVAETLKEFFEQLQSHARFYLE